MARTDVNSDLYAVDGDLYVVDGQATPTAIPDNALTVHEAAAAAARAALQAELDAHEASTHNTDNTARASAATAQAEIDAHEANHPTTDVSGDIATHDAAAPSHGAIRARAQANEDGLEGHIAQHPGAVVAGPPPDNSVGRAKLTANLLADVDAHADQTDLDAHADGAAPHPDAFTAAGATADANLRLHDRSAIPNEDPTHLDIRNLITAHAGTPHGGSGGGITLEQARDAIAAILTEGDNVTIVYDDAGAGAGTITVNASGGTSGLSAEDVRDLIGEVITAGANVTVTVDDAANTVTITTVAGEGGGLTVAQVSGGCRRLGRTGQHRPYPGGQTTVPPRLHRIKHSGMGPSNSRRMRTADCPVRAAAMAGPNNLPTPRRPPADMDAHHTVPSGRAHAVRRRTLTTRSST